MAVHTILQYPDPRLRLKAKPVIAYDAALARLVQDMIDTMFHASGMGLAAPQINIQQQVIVMDLSNNSGQPEPFAVINPRITRAEGEQVRDEYCLSVIDYGVPVKRATTIDVTYFDVQGQAISRTVHDLEARCFQHEMDHLAGRVTIDYLTGLKRKLYDSKCAKWLKKRKVVI